MKYLLLLFLLTAPLFAERFVPDASARSFESIEVKKMRVDTFDFEGDFPELEEINIDARKKKNVELFLTGSYPLLERINYEGSFGILSGKITGDFPNLRLINLICRSCSMKIDLDAPWSRSCSINIHGADEDVVLTLPKNVGVEIHTKVAIKGKVIPSEGLKKMGKMAILKKSYVNELVESSPILLTIYVEVADGRIILN